MSAEYAALIHFNLVGKTVHLKSYSCKVITKSCMTSENSPSEGSRPICKVRHQLPCQADVLLVDKSGGSQRF